MHLRVSNAIESHLEEIAISMSTDKLQIIGLAFGKYCCAHEGLGHHCPCLEWRCCVLELALAGVSEKKVWCTTDLADYE